MVRIEISFLWLVWTSTFFGLFGFPFPLHDRWEVVVSLRLSLKWKEWSAGGEGKGRRNGRCPFLSVSALPCPLSWLSVPWTFILPISVSHWSTFAKDMLALLRIWFFSPLGFFSILSERLVGFVVAFDMWARMPSSVAVFCLSDCFVLVRFDCLLACLLVLCWDSVPFRVFWPLSWSVLCVCVRVFVFCVFRSEWSMLHITVCLCCGRNENNQEEERERKKIRKRRRGINHKREKTAEKEQKDQKHDTWTDFENPFESKAEKPPMNSVETTS